VTPKKSAPSKAVAKAALKVPSTRVDAGKAPSKALAVRAAEPMMATYGTGSSDVTITITHTSPSFTGVITVLGTVQLPFTSGSATVTVPASALGAIEDLGFPVTFGAPGPAPAYDANLDTLVAPIVEAATSATRAKLGAAFESVLIYASGAYPARPAGVPGGLVKYIGPVQPSDWLANDAWVDNS